MCPDTKTLSVYFDGELSRFHRNTVEKHLPRCAACRATLELFAAQRELIRADAVEDIQDVGDIERFWAYVGRSRLHSIGEPRRISLPIPVAAAAALALVVATLFNFLPVRKPTISPLVVVDQRPQSPTVVSLTITPGEVENLLAILEGRQGINGDSIHTLPEEIPFARFGEPQILRPASLEGAP